jgi:hypothetical protein
METRSQRCGSILRRRTLSVSGFATATVQLNANGQLLTSPTDFGHPAEASDGRNFITVNFADLGLSAHIPVAGLLSGSSAVGLLPGFDPAYVQDLSGTPIPGASIASASGHDYYAPLPEPARAIGHIAGLTSVLALGRQRRVVRPGERSCSSGGPNRGRAGLAVTSAASS